MRLGKSGFDDRQREYWAEPKPAHDAWRTGHRCIRAMELALLTPIADRLLSASTILDVGCGEADMLHLFTSMGFRGTYVGVDQSRRKLTFARDKKPCTNVLFASADARRLPFRDRSFPVVLCRDLLHHVADRESALKELLRVASNRLVVIEPNPLTPLVGGLALARAAERGILLSVPPLLWRLARRVGADWQLKRHWAEPQSFTRALLHFEYGWPSLAERPEVVKALAMFERFARRLPEPTWNYQILEFERS